MSKNSNNGFGGWAGKNSGSGSYQGGKGNRGPRASNNSRNQGNTPHRYRDQGKSSFASPEMVKAAGLVAAIPVTAIVLVVGYFTGAAFGAWS